MDTDSSGNLHDLFRLGFADLLPGGPPAEGCDGGLRRSQTVDVEVRVRERTARPQPAARAGWPRRQDDHEFAGRDPQLLRAGISYQGWRASRTIYCLLVPSP